MKYGAHYFSVHSLSKVNRRRWAMQNVKIWRKGLGTASRKMGRKKVLTLESRGFKITMCDQSRIQKWHHDERWGSNFQSNNHKAGNTFITYHHFKSPRIFLKSYRKGRSIYSRRDLLHLGRSSESRTREPQPASFSYLTFKWQKLHWVHLARKTRCPLPQASSEGLGSLKSRATCSFHHHSYMMLNAKLVAALNGGSHILHPAPTCIKVLLRLC